MADIERRAGNARMSRAVIHRGVAYLSGQVAARPCGSFEEEARACLAGLDAALAEAGTDRGRLLSATVYLADLRRIAAFDAVWEGWVPCDALPARVAIQTPMVDPGRSVAVQAIAALPETRAPRPDHGADRATALEI